MRCAGCVPAQSTFRAASSPPRASRTPPGSLPSSRECAMRMYDLPDASGHFGQYGGIFVSETLISALEELKAAYERYRNDPEFLAEFAGDLKHYVGRPSPVYHARRLSGHLGGAQIYLK